MCRQASSTESLVPGTRLDVPERVWRRASRKEPQRWTVALHYRGPKAHVAMLEFWLRTAVLKVENGSEIEPGHREESGEGLLFRGGLTPENYRMEGCLSIVT